MNSLQTLVDSPVIERLGWTLWHSAWQGLAVALVLAILLRAVRRRGARAAYAVCCGALLLTVLLPAVTFCVLPDSPPTRTMQTRTAPIVVSPPASNTSSIERPSEQHPMPTFVIVPIDGAPAHDVTQARTASTPVTSLPGASISERPTGKPSPDVSAPSAPSLQASLPISASWSERGAILGRELRERLSVWLPWAVLAWTAGVLALSLWNVAGWFAVRRLKSQGTRSAPAAIQQAAARIAVQLGLVRSVRLLQSTLVDSPVVIGAIKPVILLPASLVTQIPADQLESLLAHELAHLLRHDYLVNLLQTAIETLLFYHPAVWWISGQVRAERENCCDDLALGVAADRAVYVRALARVAGVRASTMAPAATGGQLIVRLRRILGVVDPASAHPARWLTGVAILSLCGAAIAFFAIGSRPAKAQAPASQAPPSPTIPLPEQKKQEAQPSKAEQPSKTAQPSKAAAPMSETASTRAKPRTSDHPQFPTKGQMQIQVFDSAGKPVPDAFIQVSIWTDEKNFRHNRNYKCDSEGHATIALPKTLWILRIWAKKRGYCEEFKNFEPNAQIHELVLPDEFAFHLVADTTLRGTVKKEDGLPVSKARVECIVGDRGWPVSTQTDDQGRWTIAGVRPGAVCEVRAASRLPGQ